MKKVTFFVVLTCVLILSPVFVMAQDASNEELSAPSAATADALAKMESAHSAVGNNLTLEDEYYIGRAVAARILEVYNPLLVKGSFPEVTLYGNRICQTLAVNSSRPEIFNGYHLIVLDSPEYNAFATPGGHIFITKTVVAAAPSEDALAGLIAHEIAHIILRHSVSAIDTTKMVEDLSTTPGRAAALVSPGNVGGQNVLAFRNSVSEVVVRLMKTGYTADQEFEADNMAIVLLAAAGYDPNAFVDMLKVLQKKQGLKGGFASTHPSPDARIANAEKTVLNYRVADTRSYRTGKQRFIVK